MKDLPLNGWPQNAKVELEDFITKEVNRKETKHFFIEMANDIKQIKEKLFCNNIMTLYENQFKDYVTEVKLGLIKSFQYHPKFKNKDIVISDRGVRKSCFVYIAIWQ